jgi:CubicO group peptidase (beta-lactamase class C family)
MPSVPSFPRIPGVPDPLNRIRIPEDLQAVTTRNPMEDPAAGGLANAAVEKLWDAGVSLYRSAVHPALQLCVRRKGHVVLDRAIGHARGNGPHEDRNARKQLATPGTPFCVYSTSKGITALVTHMLIERGALGLNDRVADHIPGYEQHGKGGTTIAHVLAHRAGVPNLPKELLDLEHAGDRELIVRLLCEQKPSHEPGALLAYHAVTGGFILGEIIERATGRSIRDVLADEILTPLNFRWGNYGVAPEDVPEVGLAYVTGAALLPPLSTLVARALSRPIADAVGLSNDPRFLTAVIPAASVITTANELSRFFEIFRQGGELDGVRVMQPSTLRKALEEQSRLEIDFTLLFPTRFSYGLMLGAKVVSPFGLDTDLAFGHLGLINIMGYADPERGVSVGLITSGKPIVYPEVARFYAVMQTIASKVPKLPESDRPF